MCVDPYGAAMWPWFTNGELDTHDGDSIAEGIPRDRVTKNIEGFKVDAAYRMPMNSSNDCLSAAARRALHDRHGAPNFWSNVSVNKVLAQGLSVC
jgi:hypothetical protein